MKLPNADRAVVPIEKLRDYSLNPNHPEGKHKARVFEEKLGIGRNDAERLRQKILEAISMAEANEQESTAYGRRFVVDFQISWPQEFVMCLAVVRTAWIVRNDEEFPRLTTCFIP